MRRYLRQYYMACNGVIFYLDADFLKELNDWELKYGEDYTVHDFKERDCTSQELKENWPSVHPTPI